MLDSQFRLLMIKAMVDGIDCKFNDIEEINSFISVLKQTIEEVGHIKSILEGDSDGLIMTDHLGECFGYINISETKIKFRLLSSELDLNEQQSKDFTRIVMACMATLQRINDRLKKNNQTIKNKIIEETFDSDGFDPIR